MRLATATVSVVLLLAACDRPDESRVRLHSWFGISGSGTALEIRTQLLAALPLGTPRAEVLRQFATAGISGIVLQRPDGTVFLRTGGARNKLVLREFALTFSFGPGDLLTDITVEEWLTGL